MDHPSVSDEERPRAPVPLTPAMVDVLDRAAGDTGRRKRAGIPNGAWQANVAIRP